MCETLHADRIVSCLLICEMKDGVFVMRRAEPGAALCHGEQR
ncbi:MAG: hypothetical protein PHR63_09045 [Methanoregulaceae archaeon]|nr:hypothetical protein [Methanoregulaceae archaeon]MDD5685876.1 hypothetical protein [Methanoregulaceae archaeon]